MSWGLLLAVLLVSVVVLGADLTVFPVASEGDYKNVDLSIGYGNTLYLTYIENGDTLHLLHSEGDCQTWSSTYVSHGVHSPIDATLFSTSGSESILAYLDNGVPIHANFYSTSGQAFSLSWDNATVGWPSLAGSEASDVPAGFRYFAALPVIEASNGRKRIHLYSTSTNAFGWYEIPSPFSSTLYQADQPSILSSGSRLHVVSRRWNESDNHHQIFYSRSETGQYDLWQTPVKLSTTSSDCRNPRIVGRGNNLIVFWEVEHATGDTDIEYCTTEDGGATWSSVYTFADTTADEELCDVYLDTGDYLQVLYQVDGVPFYRRAYVPDWSFGPLQVLPSLPAGKSWLQSDSARSRGAIVGDQNGDPIMILRASDNHLYMVLSTTAVAPSLCTSVDYLDFGTSATKKKIEVWNCGGGTLTFTAGDNRSWITINPTSGTSSGEHEPITVSVDRSGLSAGHHTGTVTITGYSAGGGHRDYFIGVTLDIGCAPLSPPTGVTATKGDNTDMVTVSWAVVANAAHYEIYRAQSQYGTYHKIKETTTSSYDNYDVTAGITYWYKIKACNSCGCSAFSRADSGYTPQRSVSAPQVPTGPATGRVNQSLSFTTGGSTCSLGHALQYSFDWGDGMRSAWSTAVTATHSYRARGTYYIRAQARCSVDTTLQSEWSFTKTVKIDIVPGAPGNVKATNGAYSTEIRVSWDAVSGATRYEVYSASSQNGSYAKLVETKGTSYANDGITTGKVYWYKVKACNDIGCSEFSVAVSGMASELSLRFVTDMDTVRVPEEGTAVFQVKLSMQPTETVEAKVSRSEGDTDITVTDGITLTFTEEDWNTYQTVTLAAAKDSDTVNGTAKILIHRTDGDVIADKEIEAIEDDLFPTSNVQEWEWFDAGWSMISVGLNPDDPSPAKVFDEVTSDLQLQHWDSETQTWQSVSDGTLTEVDPFSGYWLWLPKGQWIAVEGSSLAGIQRCTLGPAGGHMIGVPYEVAWGSGSSGSITVERVDRGEVLEVKSLVAAVTAGWIYDTVWAWDNRTQAWQRYSVTSGVTMDPWQGYWIDTFVDDLVLRFSPEPWRGTAVAASSRKNVEDPPRPGTPSKGIASISVRCTPATVTDLGSVEFSVAGICPCSVHGVQANIYDLSGRRVWSGETEGPSLIWDGRDDLGQQLANGVYVYRAHVRIDGRWVVTPAGTVVILR